MIHPVSCYRKKQVPASHAFFLPDSAEPGSAANFIFDMNTTTAIDLDQGQYHRCLRISLSFTVPRDRCAEAVGSELFISCFDRWRRRVVSADSERRRRHTRQHSALLLIAMAALLSYCGWIVAEWNGILWSLLGGAMMLVLARRVPPGLVLRAIGARPVARRQAPVLYEMLDGLCRRAGLDRVPHLCWVGERFPVAFTIGGGEATTIALSEGLVHGMTVREIRGILAHEIAHVRNGDIALMQLAMVVGQLTRTLSQIAFLLVFFSLFMRTVSAPSFPIVPLLVLAVAPLGVGLLQLALSRTREGEADLEAAELTGDPHGLASALVKMRRQEQMLLRGRFRTATSVRVPSLLRDHPATEERIQALLDMPQPPDAEAPDDDLMDYCHQCQGMHPWG
jgi:heat shock protein HtpX